MRREEDDDIYGTKWFRALVISSLLAGAGGGVSSLTKDTSDRYKGEDAERDFSVRDARIISLSTRVGSIEGLQQAHLQHSAAYTQIITQLERDVEKLEAKVERMEHERDK